MNITEWKNTIAGLHGKLEIDKDHLEEECQRQPVLYEEVGLLASEARGDAREAKDHVEFVKARLRNDIRANPQSYGLDKVTEGTLDAAVIANVECQEAIRQANELSRVSDALGVLQTAAEQRKAMLRNMTELYVHQYYQTNVGQSNSMPNGLNRANVSEGISAIENYRNRTEDDALESVIED